MKFCQTLCDEILWNPAESLALQCQANGKPCRWLLSHPPPSLPLTQPPQWTLTHHLQIHQNRMDKCKLNGSKPWACISCYSTFQHLWTKWLKDAWNSCRCDTTSHFCKGSTKVSTVKKTKAFRPPMTSAKAPNCLKPILKWQLWHIIASCDLCTAFNGHTSAAKMLGHKISYQSRTIWHCKDRFGSHVLRGNRWA